MAKKTHFAFDSVPRRVSVLSRFSQRSLDENIMPNGVAGRYPTGLSTSGRTRARAMFACVAEARSFARDTARRGSVLAPVAVRGRSPRHSVRPVVVDGGNKPPSRVVPGTHRAAPPPQR